MARTPPGDRDKHDWLRDAVRNNNIDHLQYLIEDDVEINYKKTTSGFHPLQLAIKKDNTQAAKILIDSGIAMDIKHPKNTRQFDNSPLLRAIKQARGEVACYMIENGVNIDCRGEENTTTYLHYAAMYGLVTVADKLIENGAELNIASPVGGTPLEVAVKNDHPEVAIRLLEAGADLTDRVREWCLISQQRSLVEE